MSQQESVQKSAQRQPLPVAANNGFSMPAVRPFQYKSTGEEALQQKSAGELPNHQGDQNLQLKPFQLKPNNTGMPDTLKSGLETMSGFDLGDVRVHHNSDKPAQLNALAYAQGNDIHLGPGQERHLPHEGWHVVQQRQGRVKPTIQMKQGVPVNDDPGLEKEADVMGARAVETGHVSQQKNSYHNLGSAHLLQRQTRNTAGNTYAIYQRVSSASVMQMVYLQDRSTNNAPQWNAGTDRPPGYLKSGRYNDGVHGDDDLYAKMGDRDLFYGISYETDETVMPTFLKKLGEIAKREDFDMETPEGVESTINAYTNEVGPPPLDVELYKTVFGGSSGWDQYTSFIPGKANGKYAEKIMELNPGLSWANDVAGRACQMAMIAAISSNGSVRFLVDGMNYVKGIMAGKAYQGKVTSNELMFVVEMMGKTIKLPGDRTIVPQDGREVFFYLNRELIPAGLIEETGTDVEKLAYALAEKIAEEEEWDDDEQDLAKLAKMLIQGLSVDQIRELLALA